MFDNQASESSHPSFISELDQLDIDKRKLEIEKLKKEITFEHFVPTRVFAILQLIIPSLITVISVGVTLWILFHNDVFDVNNKLLEIRRDSLNKSISRAGFRSDSLTTIIAKLHNDSVRLSITNHISDSILGITKSSLTDQQRQLIALTLGIKRKDDSLSEFSGKYYQMLANAHKEYEKRGKLMMTIVSFESVFDGFLYNLRLHPDTSGVSFIRTELHYIDNVIKENENN